MGFEDGLAWCAIFVAWCAEQANIDTTSSSADPPYVLSNTAWVPTLEDFYRNSNRLLTPSAASGSNNAPIRGDLAFIEKGSDPEPDHVGIVVSRTGVGSNCVVYTIDGNYDDDIQRIRYTYNASTGRFENPSGHWIKSLGSQWKQY